MSFVLKTHVGKKKKAHVGEKKKNSCGKNSQVVSLSLTYWIWSFIHSLCYEYESTSSNLEILIRGHTQCWMLRYQSFFFSPGDFP